MRTSKNSNRSISLFPYPQVIKLSTLSSTISYLARSAQQRSSRGNTCINFLKTSDLSLFFSSVDLFTGGNTKISTLVAITKAQASLCLKSKTVTASVATLKLSGSQLVATVSTLMIVIRCCSTCLNNVTSLAQDMAKRYAAIVAMDLIMVAMS
jgi:hypothetical protein